MNMGKWQRVKYQPNLPLYGGKERVTGSERHIALSRRAAGEGMVLLKNENHALPLAAGERVALFGKGGIDYVKGGGGSGDVTVAYVRNLWDGMRVKEAEEKVSLFSKLEDFYKEEMERQYREGAVPGMTVEPEVPRELLEEARAFTDTAVISICRFSGEAWDRKTVLTDGYKLYESEQRQIELSNRLFENGDYYLTKAEETLIKQVEERFSKVIVVLNVGGMVDSTWFKHDGKISGVLLSWQAGMEGGLAAADVLCGDVNPSGKLTDTFAASLEDYPSSDTFHESVNYVDYTEDIYVGYRYFETMPGMQEKVNYPFGFGLSYTDFKVQVTETEYCREYASIEAEVTNTGSRAGKEVVQVYCSAPQGKLGKPFRVLADYQKTRLLAPGEMQRLYFRIPYTALASYDDLGKVKRSAYVLEAGEYWFYVGTSVEHAERLEKPYRVEQDTVTEQLSAQVTPHALKKRLLADGSFEGLPTEERKMEREMERQDYDALEGIPPKGRIPGEEKLPERAPQDAVLLKDVYEGRRSMDELLAQLSDGELAALLGGQPNTGVANTYGMGNNQEHGIPNVMTADGPAGLRIAPECGVTTTAWPCATLLACTWNPALIEEVGRAGAEEVKENNLGIWLTPAMNIHRSPLCGRNFEYYSEDPLVAGRAGAAMVRGIQSVHIGASVKHFACNNKETNRKDSDSRVSERALREIYLKGFEIVVKEAHPYTIMSSYNKINGIQASEHRELLTNILREEWGFDGIVTTDWWTHGEQYREIKAGNDLKMGCGYPERVMEALARGLITRAELELSVRRLLEMILKID